MATWKHVDSELDRTCGLPVTIITDTGERICRACGGDVYRTGEMHDPELAWLEEET